MFLFPPCVCFKVPNSRTQVILIFTKNKTKKQLFMFMFLFSIYHVMYHIFSLIEPWTHFTF